tara:strand:- start:906 stop:1124 length:219 start_codon:yes stop_codon:yes gene_type:complete
MKYKLLCRQRECYYADDYIFNNLKEIKDTLIDYHNNDCNENILKKCNLSELLEYYEWEVHDAKTEEFIYIDS